MKKGLERITDNEISSSLTKDRGGGSYAPKSIYSEGFWSLPIAFSIVAVPLFFCKDKCMDGLGYILLGLGGMVAAVNVYYDYVKKKRTA